MEISIPQSPLLENKRREISPGVALLLSVLLPGLGHLYCGKRKAAWLTVSVFVFSVGILLGTYSGVFQIQFNLVGEFGLVWLKGKFDVNAGLLLCLLLYISAFLDAYLRAGEIPAGIEEYGPQRPRVAALLNLLTGGLGYLYLGKRGKAGLAYLLLAVVFFYLRLGLLFALVLMCLAVDAYLVARREVQEVLGHLPEVAGSRRPARGLAPAVPITLACLVAGVYVGLVLPREPWTRHNRLGQLAFEKGHYSEAEREWLAAIREAEGFGLEDPRLATSLAKLAELYRAKGEYNPDELSFQLSRSVVRALFHMGEHHRLHGEYADGESRYRNALAVAEKTIGQDNAEVAALLNSLGELYRIQERYAEAEPLYKRSLAISEKNFGTAGQSLWAPLNNLALVYDRQGKSTEAEAYYKRALQVVEKAPGSEKLLVQVLSNYEGFLRDQGRPEEAAKLNIAT